MDHQPDNRIGTLEGLKLKTQELNKFVRVLIFVPQCQDLQLSQEHHDPECSEFRDLENSTRRCKGRSQWTIHYRFTILKKLGKDDWPVAVILLSLRC